MRKDKDGKIGLMKACDKTDEGHDDQQTVLSLPAKWWPEALLELESKSWWQRLQKRVKCRLQEVDTKMRMEQVRKVMTVNQDMENESNWGCLTSEQVGSASQTAGP